MIRMEDELLTMLLGLVASLATVGIAYLKKELGSTKGKKSEAEEQADLMLDFVEAFADALEEKYPGDADLKSFNKHLRKLRRMWDNAEVTTDDVLDYLGGLKG